MLKNQLELFIRFFGSFPAEKVPQLHLATLRPGDLETAPSDRFSLLPPEKLLKTAYQNSGHSEKFPRSFCCVSHLVKTLFLLVARKGEHLPRCITL